MSFAILAFNITHPGVIRVGAEAELPSLWGMVRSKFSRGQRKGKFIGEDGEELVSNYAVFENKGQEARYSSGFAKVDGSPPPPSELDARRITNR